MRRKIGWPGFGWLGFAGVFGLLAAANAQMPPASTAYDGTYAPVSSAKVTATYTTQSGQTGFCPELTAGPLTVAGGRVQYTTATGHQLVGTVGPQGQLTLGSQAPPSSGAGYRPVVTNVSGGIDPGGTARARQIGNSCSYDFVWQKQAQ
jgi:hypothetical protein